MTQLRVTLVINVIPSQGEAVMDMAEEILALAEVAASEVGLVVAKEASIVPEDRVMSHDFLDEVGEVMKRLDEGDVADALAEDDKRMQAVLTEAMNLKT